MRKFFGLAFVVAALVITPVAISATLSNANGQTCEGTGTWHFVNNQTGGAQTAGMLTANFSGGLTLTAEATTVLQNTQHFFVSTPAGATLLSGSTNLAGRLVLSDFSCDGGKKGGKK